MSEDELVKAAGEAFLECDRVPSYSFDDCIRAAIAVMRPVLRAEALEEAAKVADGWVGCSEWSADTNSGYECASREIAAAIRALMGKK